LRFREAVTIVRALVAAPGGKLSFEELKAQTGEASDELDETLAQMMDGRVIRRAGRSGYELAAGTRELLAQRRAPPEEPPLRKARRGRARSGRSFR